MWLLKLAAVRSSEYRPAGSPRTSYANHGNSEGSVELHLKSEVVVMPCQGCATAATRSAWTHANRDGATPSAGGVPS